MEAYVRSGSKADISRWAETTPIHHSVPRILIMAALMLGVAGLILYFGLDSVKVPFDGRMIANISKVFAGPDKSTLYWVFGLSALLLLGAFKYAMFLVGNGTPLLTLSKSGITLRDGTVLPWGSLKDNTYHTTYSMFVPVTSYIALEQEGGKTRVFLFPSIGSKEYLQLCDHYSKEA